jgi:2-polyprenyl-3-methyl-5-hydroxy-6-metoxy-1,4-benzoquinol methylase
MPPQTTCPVCQSTERKLFVRSKDMDVFECADCRLVYMDPMPNAATIAALYGDAYDGATSGYFAKVESKMRRVRRRAAALSRLVPPRADGQPRRLLDVGANGGFMVEAAREVGFAATGVELDGAAVAYARQHYPENDFFHGSIEAFDGGAAAPFDAVYCSEVIEHVPDVNAFVAALAALMRPDAVLYLTTPDIGHWRRPRDIATWDAFCPPSHCLYFSAANLGRLLARHDLKVFRRRLALKPGLKVLARKSAVSA